MNTEITKTEYAPLVTFLMSVYNGQEYIRETLDSILSQTYSNWELVVINDCSTDSTETVLEEYSCRDDRIRVYKNEENLRLQRSLNRGLTLVRGEFIARIDADDVCYPQRLERQLMFLHNHPELAMSSCDIDMIIDGVVNKFLQLRRGDRESIKALLLFYNPIIHDGVMIRSSVAGRYRYNEDCTCSEDYELWTRMVSDGYSIAVQKETLMQYRRHAGQITSGPRETDRSQFIRNAGEYYRKMVFKLSEEELNKLSRAIYYREEPDCHWCIDLFNRIENANRTSHNFTNRSLAIAETEVALDYVRIGAGLKLILWTVIRHPLVTIPDLFRRFFVRSFVKIGIMKKK